MTKTSSGYRITVTAFIAADPGDIDSLDRAVSHMRTIKTAIGRSPLLSSVALTYLWVQRHKIEESAPSSAPTPAHPPADQLASSQVEGATDAAPGEGGDAASTSQSPATQTSDDAPGSEPTAAGGGCRHEWVPNWETDLAKPYHPTDRCKLCGSINDLLDLTGTPLDRRARA